MQLGIAVNTGADGEAKNNLRSLYLRSIQESAHKRNLHSEHAELKWGGIFFQSYVLYISRWMETAWQFDLPQTVDPTGRCIKLILNGLLMHKVPFSVILNAFITGILHVSL